MCSNGEFTNDARVERKWPNTEQHALADGDTAGAPQGSGQALDGTCWPRCPQQRPLCRCQVGVPRFLFLLKAN